MGLAALTVFLICASSGIDSSRWVVYLQRAVAPIAVGAAPGLAVLLWVDRCQADHTQLDLHLVPDQRPWLTVILDDHSRCVAGYSLSLTAPSALHTSLALRQAIWRKPDAGWDICGIPDLLYVDHGSDFTSRHIEQVTAALGIQLVHSAVGRPRGRGKIERFFRTVNQLLISELPGYAPRSRPLTRPGLSLSELEERIRSFFVNQYNRRRHSQTNQAPQQRWNQGGFIPKQAETLETLDLLLATVAKPRVVHRDGIRFTGYRYVDTTLAGYIGEGGNDPLRPPRHRRDTRIPQQRVHLPSRMCRTRRPNRQPQRHHHRPQTTPTTAPYTNRHTIPASGPLPTNTPTADPSRQATTRTPHLNNPTEALPQ